jgi:outer membrane receptor for ferrienterochelin and colicin
LPGGAEQNQQSRTDDDKSSALQKILDLDLESLAKTPIRESSAPTDPIVESPSKSPEKASAAPGIVNVITARDIEEFGAKNLYEVLRWATSVYMTGSFMYPENMASIRGDIGPHEGNHVLVLINGRPFRELLSGGCNFPIFTALSKTSSTSRSTTSNSNAR